MARNDYLERQNAMKQAYFDAGEEVGIQKMWDFLQMALRHPKVVRDDIWGHDRIKRLFTVLTEIAEEYNIAFTDHPEADVKQEEMDSVLREVWGDELKTFYERYPNLKKFDYTKPHKNWR